eukprot:TRINITY_DN6406_c0_g1_i1.p1 TRINITY_DN6406_c0_g1~~TRINITY_DN6406_c0_g1_i1.p1  ORF type:complete len:737 (+),score=176.85 TRINITY_DN6406_c0_g1_i1:1228-3438(+)
MAGVDIDVSVSEPVWPDPPDSLSNIKFEPAAEGERPMVHSATLNKLICRLTSPDFFDIEMLKAFVGTYQSFTRASTVLNKLIERYRIPPELQGKAMSEDDVRSMQLRVCRFIKFWIEARPADFLDPEINKTLRDFIANDVTISTLATQLSTSMAKGSSANLRGPLSIHNFVAGAGAATAASGAQAPPAFKRQASLSGQNPGPSGSYRLSLHSDRAPSFGHASNTAASLMSATSTGTQSGGGSSRMPRTFESMRVLLSGNSTKIAAPVVPPAGRERSLSPPSHHPGSKTVLHVVTKEAGCSVVHIDNSVTEITSFLAAVAADMSRGGKVFSPDQIRVTHATPANEEFLLQTNEDLAAARTKAHMLFVYSATDSIVLTPNVCRVYLDDGTYKMVPITGTTTVKDVVSLLASKLKQPEFATRTHTTLWEDGKMSFLSHTDRVIDKLNSWELNTRKNGGSETHHLVISHLDAARADDTHAVPIISIAALPTDGDQILQIFLNSDVVEIAKQLTLIDFYLFSAIQASELLNQAWNKPNLRHRSPSVLAYIYRFNQVSSWISSLVLWEPQLRERRKIFAKILELNQELRKLNNFNSVAAVNAGLNISAVHRLKKTKETLTKQQLEAQQELKTLMEPVRSYAKYRDAIHSLNPPCVPFLGVYLRDLTFLEDGNENLSNGLINFQKRRRVFAVISEIQQYQQTRYTEISVCEPLNTYLTWLPASPEDYLYDASLKLEPRESAAD